MYDLCREAALTRMPLIDLLVAHPEINRPVDRTALAMGVFGIARVMLLVKAPST